MEPSFSYWERAAFIDHADVIIIGSGQVGLSAALHLKQQQPQLKVLVLERGFLPSGACTKNAGFACSRPGAHQNIRLKFGDSLGLLFIQCWTHRLFPPPTPPDGNILYRDSKMNIPGPPNQTGRTG